MYPPNRPLVKVNLTIFLLSTGWPGLRPKRTQGWRFGPVYPQRMTVELMLVRKEMLCRSTMSESWQKSGDFGDASTSADIQGTREWAWRPGFAR